MERAGRRERGERVAEAGRAGAAAAAAAGVLRSLCVLVSARRRQTAPCDVQRGELISGRARLRESRRLEPPRGVARLPKPYDGAPAVS